MLINKHNASIIDSIQYNIHDAEINDFQYKLSEQSLVIQLLDYYDSNIKITFKNIRYLEFNNDDIFTNIDANWLYGWETFSIDKIHKLNSIPYDSNEFGVLITFCNLSKLYIITSEIEWYKNTLEI